jgi:LysM repeat protein
MANAYRSMPGRRTLNVVAYRKPAPRQAQQPEKTSNAANGPAEAVVPAEAQSIYIVKEGDTLSKIAKKTGTTVDALCEKNNITRRTILRIGRRLVL